MLATETVVEAAEEEEGDVVLGRTSSSIVRSVSLFARARREGKEVVNLHLGGSEVVP